MSTRPADIYLRFLKLAESLRGLPNLPSLDPLEERILHLVARCSTTGDPLSVRKLIAHDALGSPATLHARLTTMREKGWLQLDATEDARRKKVSLTPAALRHFDRLAECWGLAQDGL